MNLSTSKPKNAAFCRDILWIGISIEFHSLWQRFASHIELKDIYAAVI